MRCGGYMLELGSGLVNVLYNRCILVDVQHTETRKIMIEL